MRLLSRVLVTFLPLKLLVRAIITGPLPPHGSFIGPLAPNVEL